MPQHGIDCTTHISFELSTHLANMLERSIGQKFCNQKI